MPQKRKLGRGLDSISKLPKGGTGEEVRNLSVDLIDPNPDQPREIFDENALAELEASIAADGILQPIVVRPAGKRYQVVMGERRLRAAMNAGRRLVPALVRDVTDPQMLELSLVENIQRQDLNPMERARAYKRLMRSLSITQDEAARRVGVSRATVANFVRLLDLPDVIQEHVSRGTISMGHARAILAIKDPSKQLQAAKKVISRDLSVRQTELLASPKPKKARKSALSPELRAVEDDLREALGTKVTLQGTAKRGKITVQYFSQDDLERIIETVTGR
ncbi:unnamed protein product [marine sediment metagenome]|uniref:ParB-like N-terminal domain-containing protein n=1 Tax=marine sediment metagenome TaxID=412755 RepID=X0SUZ3_9ZZZZ